MKKISGVIMVMAIIICQVFTTIFVVNADSAKVTFKDTYLLFQTWQGMGDSYVNVGEGTFTKDLEAVKYENFQYLEYDNKTFSDENYFATDKNGNLILTLKEAYLKTLEDGTYIFNAIFKKAIIPIKIHVVTHKILFADGYFSFPQWTGKGDAKVNMIPNKFSYRFYPELFKELFYKGNKVSKANYSVTQFQNVTSVVLNEKYLKMLPEGTSFFTADFLDAQIMLKLSKKTQLNISIKKVSNIKVTTMSKKYIIKWKKQKKITGYVIKTARNKKMTKHKNTLLIKKNVNSKKIIRRKGKKLYIKIRAYVTSNGKTSYGKWSNIKTLKK